MNQNPWGTQTCEYNTPQETLHEEIKVMKRQETTIYKCEDYILCRKLGTISVDPSTSVSKNSSKLDKLTTDCDIIDPSHRTTMCEWCYRVVDHIGVRRELVEISMNYLDRFLHKIHCDRDSFKLAAITAMYLTIKIHCRKNRLTIKSLSALSKGEFSAVDIADMEFIILQTLSWNLHPPTSMNFIYHFHTLLPPKIASSKHTILQRSCFFAELAVMEYNPYWNRSQIAFSAILNAIDELDLLQMSKEERESYIATIEKVCGVDHTSKITISVREKLWELYAHSAQFQLHDIGSTDKIDGVHDINNDTVSSNGLSPVCVGGS